ncbi:class I SAM-dependent methyltransferase [Hyphobacterium marinum]|uniref:Methyltransferase type 11 domain-containing protein n=1 Tax=Hyphobacterium marinum TaxID=3116574 RepID=A0ABU7LUR0_9PROT|nr:hypothetical protein [Hyphobacterium sp. Y6023]MEE2565289.1 hypothetical protein [Hyphobacterium sp. Y6023]
MRYLISLMAAFAIAACTPADDAADTRDAAIDESAAEDTAKDSGDSAPGSGDQAEYANANQAAVNDAARPEQDRARDATRHPAEILNFAGVEPGWAIADIGAGGGYYTRILSRAVGANGTVYAHNYQWVVDRFPNADTALTAIAGEYDNVDYYVATAADVMSGVDAPLDAAFIVLGYHDLIWQQPDIQTLTREERIASNRLIYDALRPGGVLIIIDHRAEDGSMDRDVDAFHRIGEAMVREEIEAAGFQLDGESDLLSNAEDTRDIGVFDPSIRGRTDRFVLRYRKPN